MKMAIPENIESSKLVTKDGPQQESVTCENDLQQKKAIARQMKDSVISMTEELRLQMDFLSNNMNVIQESIYSTPALLTLEMPRDIQRTAVKDIQNAPKTLQSEYEAAVTVENVLSNWEDFSESWEHRVNDLDRNIMNLNQNFLQLCKSLDSPS